MFTVYSYIVIFTCNGDEMSPELWKQELLTNVRFRNRHVHFEVIIEIDPVEVGFEVWAVSTGDAL
jgi:hypothetical protein